jgi:hypothetical protein
MAIEALRRSPEILLIIPNGFYGALRLVKDPRHGGQLSRESNRFVVEFPESGTVALKDFEAFEQPHVLKAQYSSGRALKVDPNDPPASIENSLWQIGTFRGTKYPLETMIYLVCPASERGAVANGLR